MELALWLLGIHVVEIAVIGIILLIRRNNALEKAVLQQREYIDAIGIIINNSNEKLKELDTLGAFEADDEVGTFFRNLREIQSIINDFNNLKS
jgi:hypothetical protein